MNKRFAEGQRGIAHLGIILIIVVLAAASLVGWWVSQNNADQNRSTLDKTVQEAIKNATCDYADQDLCKFFTSWEAADSYTITSTAKVGDETTTTIIKSEGDDKTHVTLSGKTPYETITIGDTLYTKAGNIWYKQTLGAENANDYQGTVDVEFTEPETEGSTVSYKKLGTEACGERTCFKYEVVDTSTPDTKQFLWFDNKDYRLRKTEVTSGGGSYTATFSYDKVSIKEPTPVQDLAPNQYIAPGQSEPTTLPDTGDGTPSEAELEQLQQYQQ